MTSASFKRAATRPVRSQRCTSPWRPHWNAGCCAGGASGGMLETPDRQTQRQGETVERAWWQRRKRKPCNQRPRPAAASRLVLGICPAHTKVLRSVRRQRHPPSRTQGDEHVKDSWWGLMRFPEAARWLSLPQGFHLHQPERGRFGFDLHRLNSGSNFLHNLYIESNCVFVISFPERDLAALPE